MNRREFIKKGALVVGGIVVGGNVLNNKQVKNVPLGAATYDPIENWANLLAVSRKPNESDSDFRERVVTKARSL